MNILLEHIQISPENEGLKFVGLAGPVISPLGNYPTLRDGIFQVLAYHVLTELQRAELEEIQQKGEELGWSDRAIAAFFTLRRTKSTSSKVGSDV